ncbi:MAG: DoxX family protein [Propionibacteriaceae bacterium]|nr:DoxX family protein [Propionibacteriaceae bacterium]
MSDEMHSTSPERREDGPGGADPADGAMPTVDPQSDALGTAPADALATETQPPYDLQHPRDWQTAAELATPWSGYRLSEPAAAPVPAPVEDAAPADVVELVEPVEATEPVEAAQAAEPVAVPAPVFPEGTIDLTEEAPSGSQGDLEESFRIPASAYAGQIAQEPVHGTVEVDHTVEQPGATVIMPVESALDDHRAARARALGEVDPGADVVTAPRQYLPPSVYKGWPSFTLFVLRLVVATLLSIRGTQELMHFTATKQLWATSVLPDPEIMAIAQIGLEFLIALMLLLGLASRVAGVLLMIVYIVVLSFLVWGASNPFVSGMDGFYGEREVLMVIIGLVFAGIGGGGAAVDGAVHRARLERKNAKLGGIPDEG